MVADVMKFTLRRRAKAVSKKLRIMILIGTVGVLTAGCQRTQDATNTNANVDSNSAMTTTGPDNSEITTANENGVRTETRTFRGNPRVSRVVVTTREGNRTVKVYSASGEEREMKSAPERALDATGDAIADSVGFVKDKSVDVADKTKEGAKTVADKTVDISKTVADKTVDTTKTVVGKTKEGSKSVADKTVDTTKTVAGKTKTAAKKTGKAIRKVVP